jgi:hypothetical protein
LNKYLKLGVILSNGWKFIGEKKINKILNIYQKLIIDKSAEQTKNLSFIFMDYENIYSKVFRFSYYP